MGRYHNAEQVSLLLRTMGGRGVDLAAGKPIPVADQTQLITESEDRVDQRIRSRYTIPVTDAVGVTLLGYVASRLTAAAIWRILQATSSRGESEKANEWERQALRLLEQIANGEVSLGDAEAATSAGSAYGGLNQNHTSRRVWAIGEDQW